MIEKPKLLAIVIIITFTGIIGIYTYAVLIEAKSVSISDLGSKHLGSIVELEGYIKNVDYWKEGEMDIILIDYDSGKTVDVIMEAHAVENLKHREKFIPGARIRVNGLVEDYQGTLQIRVSSSEGVKLIKSAASSTLPLEVILKKPEVFEGILVVIQGKVWDIDEIESLSAFTFTLQNSSKGRYYSVSCIVFNASEFLDMDGFRIQSGDDVVFTGFFEYYEQKGTWQIQSQEGKESLVKVN